MVASVPLIPKFARECAASACELRNRDTSRHALTIAEDHAGPAGCSSLSRRALRGHVPFNNASARRGVLTGSVAQALAITVPIGVPCSSSRRSPAAISPRYGALRAKEWLSGAGRPAAFRGGTLRQFSRRPGDRRQPGRAGDPAQPRGHAGARGARAQRAAHAAAHRWDRTAGAGTRADAQRRRGRRAQNRGWTTRSSRAMPRVTRSP